METDDVTAANSGAVVGVGVDLVDIVRFEAALARTPTLAARLFTDDEVAYCTTSSKRAASRFAARFAAKEAAMKALGVGLGGIGWHEIEVARDPSGRPSLVVTGRAMQLATDREAKHWLVSLTHTREVAEATVLLTR